MKNIGLFACCLMIHMTMYCMELEKQDESSKNITYKEHEQILIDDCKGQLKNCLETYKTSDEFKPQDMENILGVLSFMTNGSENSIDYIHRTKDDELNGFFEYALKKIDLPIMQWLIAKGNIKHHLEKECASFIEFCTEQLSPSVDSSKRDTAYAILKSIIEHYKTDAVFQSCKEYYLQIMVMLQLKHRALETKFIIEEELLIPFLQHNQVHNVHGLSDMYQTVVNEEDNNTLAHIIVEQYDADELHILMKKNYISKEARNSAGRTVNELAFDKFRAFTQDTSSISVFPEKAQATRCCYFMLNKYFAEKDFDKQKNCCDKHPVFKKYGFDLLKQSPSVSLSPSASSSSSSESLVMLEKQPESVGLEKSLAKSKVIADEPEKGNCCTQMMAYFAKISMLK